MEKSHITANETNNENLEQSSQSVVIRKRNMDGSPAVSPKRTILEKQTDFVSTTSDIEIVETIPSPHIALQASITQDQQKESNLDAAVTTTVEITRGTFKNLEESRVKDLLELADIGPISDPISSTRLMFFRKDNRVLMIETNHRASMISRRELTDQEEKVSLDCTQNETKSEMFDAAWSASQLLDKPGDIQCDRNKLPNQILSFCVRYMTKETFRNQANFTLEEEMMMYFDFLGTIYTEDQIAIMRDDVRERNLEFKKLIDAGYFTDKCMRHTEWFQIFCAGPKTRQILTDAVRDGFPFSKSDGFIRTVVSGSLLDDESTAKILTSCRSVDNETKKVSNDVQKASKLVKQLINNKKRSNSETGKRKSAATERPNAEATCIININEVNEEGAFVIIETPDEKSNTDEQWITIQEVFKKNLNLVLLNGKIPVTRKIVNNFPHYFGYGKVKNGDGKPVDYFVCGPEVPEEVDVQFRKSCFHKVSSVVNVFHIHPQPDWKTGCVAALYHLKPK